MFGINGPLSSGHSCIRGVLTTIVFMFSVVAFGCATIENAPQPQMDPSKIAIIRVDPLRPANRKIQITMVDGKVTAGYFRAQENQFVEEVTVLPGKHKIWTKINLGSAYAFGYLWLVAEPGETYVVKARFEGYGSKMWIENERTGQEVGGPVGSKDEPTELEV